MTYFHDKVGVGDVRCHFLNQIIIDGGLESKKVKEKEQKNLSDGPFVKRKYSVEVKDGILDKKIQSSEA